MKQKSERELYVAQMEERLRQAESDVKYLAEVNKRLKIIEKNVEVLDQYYSSPEWMDDYENLETVGTYDILNQDSLFNALQEIYFEKIKMLKHIVKQIR